MDVLTESLHTPNELCRTVDALVRPRTIHVALVDSLRFTRECLIRAFGALHPDLVMTPFSSVTKCIQTAPDRCDLILHYSHEPVPTDTGTFQEIKALRAAFPSVPVLVVSDARSAQQPKMVRAALASGAQGIVPSLTTEVAAVFTAIQFVKDGGTFLPRELLLAEGEEQPYRPASSIEARFTPRQLVVLSLLRQGKANKAIAYELGMKENTVKVHIHNIMRKMGATSRTHAVYLAELIGDPMEVID
jgi:DNA-binding NarL/FixJ family response regulator